MVLAETVEVCRMCSKHFSGEYSICEDCIDNTYYSPNSFTVKGYYIYALADPISNLVFYVGLTVNPEKRFAAHIAKGSSSSNKEYITDLKRVLKKPKMWIVEYFKSDHILALQIEKYWQREFLKCQEVTGVVGTLYPDFSHPIYGYGRITKRKRTMYPDMIFKKTKVAKRVKQPKLL